MTFILLLAATLAVVVLPMLPAILEWRRPTDAAPLAIEASHALDPSGFASSFAGRLAEALLRGETKVGQSVLASAGAEAAAGRWPLTRAEAAAGCNHRTWHTADDALLPAGQSFLAEVACGGTLCTAPGAVYRALLGAARLSIADSAVVLRWAHADAVDVSPGCWLAGRVSASQHIRIDGRVRFTLLHAPVVDFGAPALLTGARVPAPAEAVPDLPPEGAVWNHVAARGVASAALTVRARRSWRGDLVCGGTLRLGEGCHARGSLKAHGSASLAAGCRVDGNIVARDLIRLNRDCVVLGSVMSETAVTLGENCVVGAPGHPATVTAPRIVVAPGVVVHGTLWATDEGTAGYVEQAAAAAVAVPVAARAPARCAGLVEAMA